MATKVCQCPAHSSKGRYFVEGKESFTLPTEIIDTCKITREEIKNWQCTYCGLILSEDQYFQAIFDECPRCQCKLAMWSLIKEEARKGKEMALLMERALYPPEEHPEEKLSEESPKEYEEYIDALKYMTDKLHNAAAAKVYGQVKGWLVEKTEVKHGLTADEITRRNLEADRQLGASGYFNTEAPEVSEEEASP